MEVNFSLKACEMRIEEDISIIVCFKKFDETILNSTNKNDSHFPS